MVNVLVAQILVGWLGALSTFYCTSRFPNQRIRISALLTLIFAMMLSAIDGIYTIERDLYLSTFFAATFIGMTNKPMLNTPHIIAATVIMILIWQWGYQYYGHLGGALGASAFVGVVTLHGFTVLWQRLRVASNNKQKH